MYSLTLFGNKEKTPSRSDWRKLGGWSARWQKGERGGVGEEKDEIVVSCCSIQVDTKFPDSLLLALEVYYGTYKITRKKLNQ